MNRRSLSWDAHCAAACCVTLAIAGCHGRDPTARDEPMVSEGHGLPMLVAEHALAPGGLWEAALVRWPNPDAGEMPCVSAVQDGVVGDCVAFAP